PNISAIGDVITLGTGAHPQLAHLSSAEGIVVAERIAGQVVRPINYDHVPSCTYCDPEIGSVGLTETEAKQKGYDVRVGSFPFGVLGRAKMAGESEGFVKIVADKKYDEILGVHMIGPRSTELVAEAVLALRLECTVEALIKPIHPHPTVQAAAETSSPAAGILTEIKVKEGETVGVNTVVATIGQPNEVGRAGPAEAGASGGGPAEAKQQADGQSTPAPTPADKTVSAIRPEQPSGNGRRRSSPLVRRIAKDHNVDIAQIAGSGIAGRV